MVVRRRGASVPGGISSPNSLNQLSPRGSFPEGAPRLGADLLQPEDRADQFDPSWRQHVSRLKDLFTDEVIGAKAFLALWIILLLLATFRISRGRAACEDRCGGVGSSEVIFEPARLANGLESHCYCVSPSGVVNP